jgi:hypothetical protein
MSKFCAIDDWETVDLASEAACVLGAAGVAAPLAIGFSIFMGGEAAQQAPAQGSEENKLPSAATPRKKSSGAQNIMNFLEPPKPSWVT